MARFCGACGYPLDGEHHELLRDDDGAAVKQLLVTNKGRGRVGFQRVRRYGCRVRLIARSPTSGKILTTSFTQRQKLLDNAYVHVNRLQPGKDLNP